MSNIIDKLKPGDLIAVAYTNCTYPAIFHKNTGASVQCYEVRKYNLQDFKEKGVKNTYKNYINSWDRNYRVVKITEDSLTENQLANYKIWKDIYEGIPV
jgi:hypothetical protein